MRKSVIWATAIAVVMAVGLPARASAGDDHDPNIAGTWTVKALFEGVFELAYLHSFSLDGRTTVVLSTGAGHPNESDPRVGCMGEWRIRPGRGPREYDVSLKCLYNQAWDGIYGQLRMIVRLDQAGKAFEGPFTYSEHTAAGDLLFQGSGVLWGARYELNPLP